MTSDQAKHDFTSRVLWLKTRLAVWKVRDWKIEKELEEDKIKEEMAGLLIASVKERAGDGVRDELNGMEEMCPGRVGEN